MLEEAATEVVETEAVKAKAEMALVHGFHEYCMYFLFAASGIQDSW